jgi:hypothetical protein
MGNILKQDPLDSTNLGFYRQLRADLEGGSS